MTLICFSCKKDKSLNQNQDQNNTVTYSNYSKLTVGNYWVYELFQVDTLGNATLTNDIDSCYIENDTIIHGVTFYSYKTSSSYYNTPTKFIRDSLHYVVNNHGDILFSSQDFTTIFKTEYSINPPADTVMKSVYKMEDKNFTVSTPSGQYVTSDFRKTIYIYPNYVQYFHTKYMHTRYAENIGIVIENLLTWFNSPYYVERRLIRFHLN